MLTTPSLMLVMVVSIASAQSLDIAQPRVSSTGRGASAEELAAVAGSETDAAKLVTTVLERFLARSAPRTVAVMGSQIPEAWLPKIKGIEYDRLTNSANTFNFIGERAPGSWTQGLAQGSAAVRAADVSREC
jgi:hypothetical protein